MADDARALNTDEVIMLYPAAPLPEGAHTEQTYRWPGGADGVGPQTTMLRNVSAPSITVVRPAAGKANGVGVIVAPGGGWRILAWEHEGTFLAQRLAGLGYTAFVLKYRLMPTEPDQVVYEADVRARAAAPNPLKTMASKDLPRSIGKLAPGDKALAARTTAIADGQAALALVRGRAAEFGVERVGMIGFSAGAFVTAGVAMDPGAGAAPLAFAACIYGGETGGAPVPADAPPLFVISAGDDRMLVRVVEGLYRDWVEADRIAELHVFTRGGHGFGTTPQDKPVDRWVELFEAWLADMGLS